MIEEYQAIYAESVALARFMDVDPEPCPFCEAGTYHICAYQKEEHYFEGNDLKCQTCDKYESDGDHICPNCDRYPMQYDCLKAGC